MKVGDMEVGRTPDELGKGKNIFKLYYIKIFK